MIIVEVNDMKKVLKAMWAFCSYLFVPQRRPTDG